jgi:probable rRNA maturation factor
MEVIFSGDKLPQERIMANMELAARQILESHDITNEEIEISVTFVDEQEIKELNSMYRETDKVTDVLSFPQFDDPGDIPKTGPVALGDVVICNQRAEEQAEEYGHSLERELGYLTAHSAFHLMGYDHMNEEEKAIMRNMEERALNAVGITREGGTPSHAQLFELACEAMQNSYSPYSHFKVGACILAADGRTFKGCNFENASYGATICAERCAASCAIAVGARRFAAIAVVGSTAVAWPCGICRQVLREFSDLDMPVIVGQYGKGYTVRTLGELLPESLSPEDLGVNVE